MTLPAFSSMSRVLLLAAGLGFTSAPLLAADILVDVQMQNSDTNPGPFSAGAGAQFSMSFRIDASVAPSGAIPTWSGALDDLFVDIVDVNLGSFTIQAQNGRWQQIDGDFLAGGWGSFNGGSIAPFAVFNPSISATAFVLDSISFDFRGAALLADEQTLPGVLDIDDFNYLSLVLRFSNADPDVANNPKTSIIRGSAFDAVAITPVPEPTTWAMLGLGLALVGAAARRARMTATGCNRRVGHPLHRAS
ncbi:PEP-CTERM sorting domain-containing protein [Methyloversatilis sp. XJ19-49]|uniref:PEP-CTERM sorting domain-containing protein n=1 Tax=Methyloversatilis sp. XJ19-49 TaxID=2963429 RepID=UPI00211BD596|nr:PEP-CTERM sorting domain-containing protein [Methyloversatilis sp. XJ19-49]MCQ9377166.1 PEP-CTERM sorting domain-containing protein [Methyloversatilis sp. XJ19-49]